MATLWPLAIFICTDTVHAALLDAIAAELRSLGVEVYRGLLDDEGSSVPWDRIDVIVPTIRQRCTRFHLERAINLRGVVYPTIGVESLDLAAANELGIVVGHGATPENFIGMAEATLMLGLALVYRLNEAVDVLHNGRSRPSPPSARMLRGKTIGLVGVGRIGSELARLLKPCGGTVMAHTRSRRPNEDIAEFVDLDTLLVSADLVFLLTTLTSDTRGMIGRDQLLLMKKSAYLVNTARGELIDEEALCEALSEQRIAGAALDVFEVEPLPLSSGLRSLDSVILTPHIIGHTLESTESLLPAAIDNIWNILNRRAPRFCKNPEIAPRWRT
ncbi:MAG: NAD(P)-dependent oxidoreductase [Terriglobales bacterium]